MCMPTWSQRHTVHTASPALEGECHIWQKGLRWFKYIRMPSSNSYHQTHYVRTYVHCHAYDIYDTYVCRDKCNSSTRNLNWHPTSHTDGTCTHVHTYTHTCMLYVCGALYAHIIWSTYGILLASLCCVLWRMCTKYVICILIDTNIGTYVCMYVHMHVQ